MQISDVRPSPLASQAVGSPRKRAGSETASLLRNGAGSNGEHITPCESPSSHQLLPFLLTTSYRPALTCSHISSPILKTDPSFRRRPLESKPSRPSPSCSLPFVSFLEYFLKIFALAYPLQIPASLHYEPARKRKERQTRSSVWASGGPPVNNSLVSSRRTTILLWSLRSGRLPTGDYVSWKRKQAYASLIIPTHLS